MSLNNSESRDRDLWKRVREVLYPAIAKDPEAAEQEILDYLEPGDSVEHLLPNLELAIPWSRLGRAYRLLRGPSPAKADPMSVLTTVAILAGGKRAPGDVPAEDEPQTVDRISKGLNLPKSLALR